MTRLDERWPFRCALLVLAIMILACSACAGARFRSEIGAGRGVLEAIHTCDAPPANWSPPEQTFYAFKVWLLQNHVTVDEIRSASFVDGLRGDGDASVDLRVRAGSPEIRLRFDPDGRLLSMGFPMNNCQFQADLNEDGLIDLADVQLARGG